MKYLLLVLLCASVGNTVLLADRKKIVQKHKQQAGIYRKDSQK